MFQRAAEAFYMRSLKTADGGHIEAAGVRDRRLPSNSI